MTSTTGLRRPAFVPFTQRVASALLLRPELYEYAATTPTAMSQAIAVVGFAGMVQPSTLTQTLGMWGMMLSLLLALLRWFAYATFIAYPTSCLLMWRRVEYKRLLRCLGFAEAPSFLNLLAYFSTEQLPEVLNVIVWVWLLLATIIALRAALSISVKRAALTGIVVFALYFVVGLINQVIINFPT